MISKVNNSPSFGMALRQEKMSELLSPLKTGVLKTYSSSASMINEYSNKNNVDIFVKGITSQIEAAADDAAEGAAPVIQEVTDKFSIKLQGKSFNAPEGEGTIEGVAKTLEYNAKDLPTASRKMKKFFNGLKDEVNKVQILTEIKKNFGI